MSEKTTEVTFKLFENYFKNIVIYYKKNQKQNLRHTF